MSKEIQSVGRDITEQRRTEADLAESEARYRALVESTADWIWQIDLEGRHIYTNARLRDVLGYTESEIAELSLEELIHPQDFGEVQNTLPGLIAEKRGWDGWVVRFRHKDGSYRYLQSSARPALDEAGRIRGFRGIDRDVTFNVLLSRVSSRLLESDPDTLDARIQESLAEVAASYGLDRASLWWTNTKGPTTSRSHEWSRPGMEGPRRSFQVHEEIPWAAEPTLGGQTLRIETLDQLPEEASRDRAFFESQGVKSTLGIPLTVESRFVGVAVYSTVAKARAWPEKTEQELRLFGQALANAYERARGLEALIRREQELRGALSEIAILRDQLEEENVQLREEVRTAHRFDRIVGDTRSLRRCLDLVERVAPTDTSVLITGETGTGKELVARSIHELSPRKDKALVSVSCAALPDDLIESEIFGHEKGAFTGAVSARQGRFELANGGTLFLDEIGDLPLRLQGKLLRVIQEGEFERLGGTKTLRVDVRLIAATNRDLEEAVDRGQFREDLYYRINTFPIAVPSLAERREDIPLLIAHFVSKHAARLGRTIERVSPWMLDALEDRPWPGNIRELESVIVRSLISTSGPVLTLPVEDAPARPASGHRTGRAVALEDVEREHILRVLRDKNWVLSGPAGAAAELGMKRTTLQSRMKKLGIRRPV